jgi:hypothetical protein
MKGKNKKKGKINNKNSNNNIRNIKSGKSSGPSVIPLYYFIHKLGVK